MTRIDRLVDDLAVLVRHRASQQIPLTKAKVDLGVVCEEALEEVKASHAHFVFELQRLGDLTGNWDRERLAQVVSNLAVNAMVHTSAKRVDSIIEDQGPFVVLKINNQGTPIPDDMPESIFDPLAHEISTLLTCREDLAWDSSLRRNRRSARRNNSGYFLCFRRHHLDCRLPPG